MENNLNNYLRVVASSFIKQYESKRKLKYRI